MTASRPTSPGWASASRRSTTPATPSRRSTRPGGGCCGRATRTSAPCTEAEVEKNRELKANCKHRNQSAERNLALFEEMLAGKYDEGQAIVRLTGDMKSDNAAFRDPTLFRIKKAAHYRHGDKYVVWPTYHINTLVMDNINGVTDVLRDKNYESWDPVHKQIMLELGLTPPRMHYEAKLKIEGTTTAKREMRELIANGKVSGWDDPRLVTVAALRRRGILPAAIRSFVLRFGMSKTDGVVSMDMLLAENKKLIDPIAKHLFFVKDPFKVVVKGEKPLSVKLRLHPSQTSASGSTGHGTSSTYPARTPRP